jgi:hypothetical protein
MGNACKKAQASVIPTVNVNQAQLKQVAAKAKEVVGDNKTFQACHTFMLELERDTTGKDPEGIIVSVRMDRRPINKINKAPKEATALSIDGWVTSLTRDVANVVRPLLRADLNTAAANVKPPAMKTKAVNRTIDKVAEKAVELEVERHAKKVLGIATKDDEE